MKTKTKLILANDPMYEVGPYHVLRNSRPYVEYIQNDEGGFYLCYDRQVTPEVMGLKLGGNSSRLRGYERLFIGKREVTLKREYQQLVTTGIVSCPSETVGYDETEEIFYDIIKWLKRVLVLGGEGELVTTAAYAMMTWFAFCYDSVPYLRFMGNFGSGKSTALRALSELCYRSVNISGVTSPAPIYRIIKQIKGTLMIDEADLRGSVYRRQVTNILNHGYTRGVAVVRMGRRNEPETFETFGPKVIATREEFSDPALESRCLTIKMPHRKIKEIESFSDARVLKAAESIRNKLLTLRMAYADIQESLKIFRGQPLVTPESWEPRVKQIVQPLFDFTPADYRKTMKGYMEAVNIGYCESLHNGTEAQVRNILCRATNMGIHKMMLAEVYQLLNYKCRKRNSHKSVSKVLERIGAYRRRNRDGIFFSWESDILR